VALVFVLPQQVAVVVSPGGLCPEPLRSWQDHKHSPSVT
jgi:hypothetical protein